VTRPVPPAGAGGLMHIALGAPFVVAGGLKIVYDVLLFARFRRIPVEDVVTPTAKETEKRSVSESESASASDPAAAEERRSASDDDPKEGGSSTRTHPR
jgi:hypothetical protein